MTKTELIARLDALIAEIEVDHPSAAGVLLVLSGALEVHQEDVVHDAVVPVARTLHAMVVGASEN